MPLLTRLYLKTSLVFFVAALLAGLAIAARPLWNLPPVINSLNPLYFHLFMVGWVTELIFGVVYWMFPKYTLENPHRSERIAWATYWLLNFGLTLRVIGEPLQARVPSRAAGWLLVASAILQWLASLAFIYNTWGRVKER